MVIPYEASRDMNLHLYSSALTCGRPVILQQLLFQVSGLSAKSVLTPACSFSTETSQRKTPPLFLWRILIDSRNLKWFALNLEYSLGDLIKLRGAWFLDMTCKLTRLPTSDF